MRQCIGCLHCHSLQAMVIDFCNTDTRYPLCTAHLQATSSSAPEPLTHYFTTAQAVLASCALICLQATVSGFSYVTQANVFKVCDQPHPLKIAKVGTPPNIHGNVAFTL